MDLLYGVGCLILGSFALWVTIKDNKEMKPKFTLEYINHLKGYFGAAIFIIVGVLKVLSYFNIHVFF